MGGTVLEQLLYTSSDIELDRGGLQVRAASPGLSDPQDKKTVAATQLCVYTGPKDRDAPTQTSYGWVTLQSTRFVFHRWAGGTDQLGRPSVCAHILVGPQQALPPLFIATRYRSPFWRTSDTELGKSATLDLVEPGQIPPADLPVLRRSQAVGFITALVTANLHNRRLAVVTTSSETFAALIAAAAQVLPDGALDSMSVSSYEGPQTAAKYTLVGVANPAHAGAGADIFDPAKPGQPADSPASQLVSTLMSSPATRDPIGMVARADGQFRYNVMLDVTQLGTALQTGDEIDPETMLAVLRSGPAAHLVLGRPAGRARVAAALVAGQPGTAQALSRAAAEPWYTSVASQLGTTVGEALWARLPRYQRADDLVNTVRSLGQPAASAFASYLAQQAANTPAALSQLPARDRLALAGLVAEHIPELAGPARDALLAAGPGSITQIAQAGNLNLSWRAAALASYLAGPPPAGPGPAVNIMVQDPQLAAEVLRQLARQPSSDTIITGILRDVPTRQSARLWQIIQDSGSGPGPTVAALLGYLQHPEVAGRFQTMTGWLADHVDQAPQAVLTPAVTSLYCDLLASTYLGDNPPGAPHAQAGWLLVRMARVNPLAKQWAVLLAAARHETNPAGLEPCLQLFSQIVSEMPGPRQQRAAAELAFADLIGHCRQEREAEMVLAWMGQWDPAATAGQNARRLLLAAQRQELADQVRLAVARWLVSHVVRGILPLQPPSGGHNAPRRLADQELQSMAEDLIWHNLSSHQQQILAGTLSAASDDVVRWWRSVSAVKTPDSPGRQGRNRG
jgi:hypothetical protein